MSLTSKPQISEAIVFFDSKGQICRQMRMPEFEAVLDGLVQLNEYQDLTMRCAFVLVDSRLMVRALVLFLLEVNSFGAADASWNVPLRRLAEKAGRGPDLGGGPIRLSCFSQCALAGYEKLLWDAKDQELVTLRNTLKRNTLCFLTDEGFLGGENLQVVSEERWYSAPVTAPLATRALDTEQRYKAAQLIKLQRKRIKMLHESHQQALQDQHVAFEQELFDVRHKYQDLLQAHTRQQTQFERLNRQLEAQVEESERLAQRLHDLKQQSDLRIAELTDELVQAKSVAESS